MISKLAYFVFENSQVLKLRIKAQAARSTTDSIT